MHYISISIQKKSMNVFFTSQFNFFLFAEYIITIDKTIDKTISKRCFRIVYNYKKKSSFVKLLEKDSSVSIHHLNLQKSTIKIIMIKNNLSLTTVRERFSQIINNYSLRDVNNREQPFTNVLRNSCS